MTNPRSDTSSNQSKRAAPPVQDAITMLTQEHREVERLFGEFEKLTDRAHVTKRKLADQICTELRKHMEIEEKIFYPAAKEQVQDNDDLVNEAIVEHSSAKTLMEEIEGMDESEELFDAKVLVLKELIEHHVEEEEDEMFPKLKKSSMDMQEIGEQMAELRQNL